MISGETKVVALIGDPVAHSISPNMHNSAFQERGMDYVYVAFRVTEKYLSEGLSGIRSLEIEGVNVTIPHKSAVMDYLDEIDERARKIGAVNTIKREGRKLKGFNTDGIGCKRALEKKVGKLENKSVTLLGAGGAARAIAFTLAEEGAKLKVSNRTESKAKELIEEIEDKTGVKPEQVAQTKEELEKTLQNSQILINSTSVGMHPNENETLVELGEMHSDLAVMDIVYNPLKTILLQEAEKAGAETINGLEMLVQQGAAAFEIWTGESAPVEAMRKAAKESLEGK